jgi:hypothetical protein
MEAAKFEELLAGLDAEIVKRIRRKSPTRAAVEQRLAAIKQRLAADNQPPLSSAKIIEPWPEEER